MRDDMFNMTNTEKGSNRGDKSGSILGLKKPSADVDGQSLLGIISSSNKANYEAGSSDQRATVGKALKGKKMSTRKTSRDSK